MLGSNGNSILTRYPLPSEAVEDLTSRGMRMTQLEDGVEFMSGHDKGIAYTFFIEPVYNKAKSAAAGYKVFDEVHMIRWLVEKGTKPTERVRELPEDLLSQNPFTGEWSGQYADAYKRFLAGEKAAGTPLRRWSELTEGQIATLNSLNIFSVEQFAEIPRERLTNKLPAEYLEAHDKAIEEMRYSKQPKFDDDAQAKRILELEKDRAGLAGEIQALKQMIEQLQAGQNAKKLKKERGLLEQVEDAGD